MNKINLAVIGMETRRSPKGRFRSVIQNVSKALQGVNGLAAQGLKQPFVVELVRVPPGALDSPYRSHSVKWEFYLILSGRGVVRTPAGRVDVQKGDCLIHPPGEAHQLQNLGAEDLVYYVVADCPASNVTHYEDTNKWSLPEQSPPGRLQAVDLFDGEE